jgi:hypothetical protein
MGQREEEKEKDKERREGGPAGLMWVGGLLKREWDKEKQKRRGCWAERTR